MPNASEHSAIVETFSEVFSLYATEHRSAIQDFLSRFPFLASLLMEAHPHLRASFPADTEFFLELVPDTDVPDAAELFAVARTSLSVEHALAALNSFDSRWWLDHARLADSRLNFDVGFSR